jgi:hypothetical protein
MDARQVAGGRIWHSAARYRLDAALSHADTAHLTHRQSPNQKPFAQVRAPKMKTSQARRNCDLEGLGASRGGASYAVYNRIGTLGNGFLALIG